jgi:hypothetical protein
MRPLFGSVVLLTALPLTLVLAHPTRAAAQAPAARGYTLALPPETPTKIEVLLTTPNLAVVLDYYRIDMRFGPNVRIDAVVAAPLDSTTRLRGVRVQVRDNENRSRQEGTSFLDFDEIAKLSRALTLMEERAAKWNGQDDRQATELSFTTSGGLRVMIRESARVPRAYISTGLFDPVVTSIDITELVTLKQAFDQALTILNGK